MATATGLTQGSTGLTRPALRPLDIAKFHLPLAVTFLSYGIVFNVINSAMARGEEAAIAIAAFAVGQSIVDLFAGPAGSGNQWLISRGRDKRSFLVGMRVMAQIALAVTAMLAVVALTPVGKWLYQGVFGAPEQLATSINSVIRLALPLPLIWAWRNTSQSVLMLRRQTHFMSLGVFLRLAFVATFAVILSGQTWLEGAGIGAALWIGGMTVEAAFLFIVARLAFRRLPAEPAPGTKLPAPAQIWRFLLPLMATNLLWAVSRPLANAAMARTAQPEVTIASFQVGWFASFLLVALQVEFRQVLVVLWSDRQSLRVLRRFALGLSAVLTALILLAGGTGITSWFMSSVLGTPPELVPAAVTVFMISALGPVLWMITELKVGQLLRNGNTSVIGVAKCINVAVMAAVMFVGVAVAPALGAAIGVLGYMGGAAAEAGVATWFCRKVGPEPASGD